MRESVEGCDGSGETTKAEAFGLQCFRFVVNPLSIEVVSMRYAFRVPRPTRVPRFNMLLGPALQCALRIEGVV